MRKATDQECAIPGVFEMKNNSKQKKDSPPPPSKVTSAPKVKLTSTCLSDAESRRFGVAADLFLADLVARMLQGRNGEKH